MTECTHCKGTGKLWHPSKRDCRWADGEWIVCLYCKEES